MTDPKEDQVATDISPWAHPKAQRWFAELLEKTHLPLMIEDELEKPDADLSPGQTRIFLALMLMLGREGIWPEHRNSVIRTVIRKTSAVLRQKKTVSKKPLTLEEHRSQGDVELLVEAELELLRRRIGMSNRKTKLGPPTSWGRIWE